MAMGLTTNQESMIEWLSRCPEQGAFIFKSRKTIRVLRDRGFLRIDRETGKVFLTEKGASYAEFMHEKEQNRIRNQQTAN